MNIKEIYLRKSAIIACRGLYVPMGRDSSIGGCSVRPPPALVKKEEPAGADHVPSLKLLDRSVACKMVGHGVRL